MSRGNPLDEGPEAGDQAIHALLEPILRAGQGRGILGPAPIDTHIRQAERFAAAVENSLGAAPEHFLDLGSGAGVPGLALALGWPATSVSLLEANNQRVGFLEWAVRILGIEGRTTILGARAEDLGRTPAFRGSFPVVVARSFGPPGVVAECAAPLLRTGGLLAVSDPPDPDPARWPEEGLAILHMNLAGVHEGIRCLRQEHACPDKFPRRPGVPSRHPLF